ncbi:NADP-dependent oxidoreductase domain-containing protein 1 isoform X1 [Hippoglossus hippoglossus]|uniref:NADP-dependent oxidoreductase domain-containing protein 1 isoform X1 n=1 Tax=Hippoglossus hippoglossus TaxID=8267 RepID=UPI00148B9ED4|nr:NADP-dependent oxidoreductase domain-containing protein 1 isoform X1 [Hippoglossus hippoglossus]
MVDITAGLNSLTFDPGFTEEEKTVIHLRARAAGLTFSGCAHALYLCKLVRSLRCVLRGHGSHRASAVTPAAGDGDLCVGILGAGHLGKQLLLSLLEMTDIKPSHIKVSTRRPESAVEFVPTGVECFFDNRRLAAWADVLFLCCLPSHLPRVCGDLRSHLSKHCLVYSFISAVPVTRLAELLGHDFILKPQYEFVGGDAADVWLSCSSLTTALKDPSLIEASCPLTMSGGITLSESWVCAVLCSLLNICTSAGLRSSDALSRINRLFEGTWTNVVQLTTSSFIGSSRASSLHEDEPFPWISLTDAQTKETPLLRFLLSNECVQQCICAAYKSLLLTPGTLHTHTHK